MRPVLVLDVTTAELVDALGADNTAFFDAEQPVDFLPRPAALTLFADEIHERFKLAVKGSSTAGSLSRQRQGTIYGLRIHHKESVARRVRRVSET